MVCWRVVEQRRLRQVNAGIDAAIADGRAAARRVLDEQAGGGEPFDTQ